MPCEVGNACFEGFQIFFDDAVGQGFSGHDLEIAALALERADCGHEAGCIRAQAALAAFNVKELFGAHVGAEAAFGDDVIGHFQRHAVATTLELPCAMFAKGPQ